MKKLLLILIIAVISFTAKAQTTGSTDNSKADSSKFTPVEKAPEFHGGIEAFFKYITKNLKYPEAAKMNKVQGKVFVTFVVEKDGSLTDITVYKSLSPETDAEAIRLITASPKWDPGIQNGRPVRVRYSMPVMFKLSDSD